MSPAEGDVLPYGSTYVFQVAAVNRASGYLWSLVQRRTIVWQNLAFDGHLSGRTYAIGAGSPAHARTHPGVLQVWVRALLPGGQWTASGVLTISLTRRTPPRPTATPRPAAHRLRPMPTVVVTATPGPKPGGGTTRATS